MIKEYDMVEAIKDLNDKVLVGCKGTVLLVYPKNPNVFEVEFFNDSQELHSIILTVKDDEIKKI